MFSVLRQFSCFCDIQPFKHLECSAVWLYSTMAKFKMLKVYKPRLDHNKGPLKIVVRSRQIKSRKMPQSPHRTLGSNTAARHKHYLSSGTKSAHSLFIQLHRIQYNGHFKKHNAFHTYIQHQTRQKTYIQRHGTLTSTDIQRWKNSLYMYAIPSRFTMKWHAWKMALYRREEETPQIKCLSDAEEAIQLYDLTTELQVGEVVVWNSSK